ncbi:universal stress protein [Actinomycetospora chibensis]|uniref:Universal stress protein n=1 Tax=Actinomycetospora chibensis TaxID=663606 RepID=A0ABV9RPG6_9PSEU|nr:universal stress protein [Actinomycetospora chibensis]MDD7922245.1 universal stress protein [Actinomycetospora chibensis]
MSAGTGPERPGLPGTGGDAVWSDGAGVIVGVAPGTGPHPEIVEGYREARRRGVGLLALTAYEPPDFWAVVPGSPPPPPPPPPTAATLRESALEALVDTVTRALTGAEPGDVDRRVTCEVAPGTARGVLAEASTRAELLVIGTARRAEARYAGALSVAADCLRHARCTVRIVPVGVTPGRA